MNLHGGSGDKLGFRRAALLCCAVPTCVAGFVAASVIASKKVGDRPVPFVLGDYQEQPITEKGVLPNSEYVDDAKDYRDTLRANKVGLDKLVARCTQKPAACSPHALSYNKMLKTLASVKDPMMQLAGVNVWVNTAIIYDKDELESDAPNRSPVEALTLGKGVCDEMAQLKNYAIHKLWDKRSDARVVVELDTDIDNKEEEAHAVVVARVKDENWVLDSNQDLGQPLHSTITQSHLREALRLDAAMENDLAHLDPDRTNRLGTDIAVPVYADNYVVASVLTKGAAPPLIVAMHAKPRSRAGHLVQHKKGTLYTPQLNDLIMQIGTDAAKLNYVIAPTLVMPRAAKPPAPAAAL